MKKFFRKTAALLAAVTMISACSAAADKATVSGSEYEFDETEQLVGDEWGITMTAKDVTPTGLTLVINKTGGSPADALNTGSVFAIEQFEDGKWTEAESTISKHERAWTMEGPLIAEKDSDGCIELKTNWEWLYGSLAPGQYRISKEVMDGWAPGNYDRKTYYAYFDID